MLDFYVVYMYDVEKYFEFELRWKIVKDDKLFLVSDDGIVFEVYLNGKFIIYDLVW